MTNLVIKQGSARPIEFRNVRDSAKNLITDFTGYTVKAQIRERPESSTVLHEWTNVGPGANVELDGPASTIRLLVDPTLTETWTWTVGRYDVKLRNPSGVPDFLDEGHITINRETTR